MVNISCNLKVETSICFKLRYLSNINWIRFHLFVPFLFTRDRPQLNVYNFLNCDSNYVSIWFKQNPYKVTVFDTVIE